MIMPNWVPQSPMWLSPMQVWPRKRKMRTREAPRMVETDVADVHGLGDVGTGEVDDDGEGMGGLGDAEVRVGVALFDELRMKESE